MCSAVKCARCQLLPNLLLSLSHRLLAVPFASSLLWKAHPHGTRLGPCPRPTQPHPRRIGADGPGVKILSEQRAADAKYSCSYWFAAQCCICRRYSGSINLWMSVPSSAALGQRQKHPKYAVLAHMSAGTAVTKHAGRRLVATAGHTLILSDDSTYPHPDFSLLQTRGRPFPCPTCPS